MLGCRGLEPGTLGAPGAALDKLPGKGCKGEKAWGGVGGERGGGQWRRPLCQPGALPTDPMSSLSCPAPPRYPCPTEQV